MALASIQETEATVVLAETLMMLACEHNIDTIVDRAMPVTWRQGVKFANDANIFTRRLGYVILLTAVLETPGTAEALILALTNHLRGFDETL